RHTSLSIGASKVNATVHTFCSFTSQVISKDPVKCIGCPFGSVGTTSGDCFTTHVYESGKWWLCESHYASSGLTPTLQRSLQPALFGGRPPATRHVYERGKGWLCESHYASSGLTTTLQRSLERALFGGGQPDAR